MKSELFLAKIRMLNFDPPTGGLSSGGQKGRGLGGRNFCPPSLFRRRRISYFTLQNAPPIQLRLTRPAHSRATSRNSLFDLYLLNSYFLIT